MSLKSGEILINPGVGVLPNGEINLHTGKRFTKLALGLIGINLNHQPTTPPREIMDMTGPDTPEGMRVNEEIIRKTYGKIGKVEKEHENLTERIPAALIDFFNEYENLRPSRTLFVGTPLSLARNYKHAVVDISRTALELQQGQGVRADLLVEGDGQALPFATDSFTNGIIMNVIHHVTDRNGHPDIRKSAHIAAQAARVCRNGVVIGDPSGRKIAQFAVGTMTVKYPLAFHEAITSYDRALTLSQFSEFIQLSNRMLWNMHDDGITPTLRQYVPMTDGTFFHFAVCSNIGDIPKGLLKPLHLPNFSFI